MAVSLEPESLYRLSLEQYHRLIEAGGFGEGAHVELIDGLLADMSPKTRAHENAIAWLTRWLIAGVDPARYEVRAQSALTLETSEPEPDIAVIPVEAPRPYHPATAALIVEVSVSSVRRDLQVKPPLYARAAVEDYWVLDLDGRRVVAHSGPSPDGYAQVVDRLAGERVTPTAAGLPELVVDEVLAAAER